MARNRSDVYAAYDFYVTAERLPDWTNELPLKDSEPLLRVVSHSASGAKHSTATASRHSSFRNVRSRPGIFDPEVFDPRIFDVRGLTIELKGTEAADFGAEVDVLVFARHVFDFWADRLGLKRLS